ncbi:serine hydrolase [Acholeplasma equirhinis]|uniref:serine hydrolase domain-containing protein n=1 Tax=Acholeplasma equirhinis TaxID=555393 RepID=UPI00197A9797|nr:serine hydrolase [Acholeplasma equirhinis]MBN3491121.1 serine hydrolase [Acholeplasma equirhinis]
MENIRIKNLIEACEKHPEIQLIDMVIMQDDQVIFDWTKPPYQKDTKHLLFSVTKSFTSLAIGILCDQGKITVDDLVSDYFKEETKDLDKPTVKELKIKHLLMMGSGIQSGLSFRNFLSGNWVRLFFNQEFPYKPGSYFAYCSLTSHMLSEIVTKVTGMTLEAFLKEHLFNNLNITDYSWEHYEGKTVGGVGLSLKTSDMMKVGKMLLHDGNYEGTQIISKTYLDQATKPQILKQNVIESDFTPHAGKAYGYQFHVSPRSYRADGAFGQLIMVFKKEKIVVVATSQNTHYEAFYTAIDQNLNLKPIKSDISSKKLNEYLTTLTYQKQDFKRITSARDFGNYLVASNELKIKEVNLIKGILTFTYEDGRENEFDVFKNGGKYGKSLFLKDYKIEELKHYIEVTWEKDKLHMRLFYIETPYVVDYTLDFKPTKVALEFKVNVSFFYDGFKVIGAKI